MVLFGLDLLVISRALALGGGLMGVIVVLDFIRGVRIGLKRKNFKCMQCGNCCRFKIIELTPDDVKRLEGAGCTDFIDNKKPDRMRRVNGKCVFLADDKCTVHEHRPRVCREFPFQKNYGQWYCPQITYCPGLDRLQDNGCNKKIC